MKTEYLSPHLWSDLLKPRLQRGRRGASEGEWSWKQTRRSSPICGVRPRTPGVDWEPELRTGAPQSPAVRHPAPQVKLACFVLCSRWCNAMFVWRFCFLWDDPLLLKTNPWWGKTCAKHNGSAGSTGHRGCIVGQVGMSQLWIENWSKWEFSDRYLFLPSSCASSVCQKQLNTLKIENVKNVFENVKWEFVRT